MPETATCMTCGVGRSGTCCASCGEKKIDAAEPALLGVLENTFQL